MDQSLKVEAIGEQDLNYPFDVFGGALCFCLFLCYCSQLGEDSVGRLVFLWSSFRSPRILRAASMVLRSAGVDFGQVVPASYVQLFE